MKQVFISVFTFLRNHLMGLVLATSHPFEASQHKKASETLQHGEEEDTRCQQAFCGPLHPHSAQLKSPEVTRS